MWSASRSVASSHFGRRIFNIQSCLTSLLSNIQLWEPNPDGVRLGIMELQTALGGDRDYQRRWGGEHRLSRSIWFFSKLWDPPKARVSAESRKAHGLNWMDEYGWMDRPDNSEELVDYLREEAAYTLDTVNKTSLMKGLKKEYDKNSSVLKKDFVEVKDGYEYWTTSKSGRELLKRRHIDSKEVETLLDVDKLSREIGIAGVGGSKISPCHKYIAFLGEHQRGSESYVLYIKDLEHGSILPSESGFNVIRMEWSSDSSKILYTVQNEKGRPWKVLIRSLKHQSEDLPVFEEKDDQFFVHVEATKDHKYIVLTTTSKTSSEVFMIDGKLENTANMHCILPRQPGHEYFAEHHKGYFYILSNATKSGNYCLKRTQMAVSEKEEWETLVQDTADFAMEDMKMFDKKCVLLGQCFGRHELRVLDMKKLEIGEVCVSKVPITDWCCHIALGDTADFGADVLRFEASSPVNPACGLEYNFDTEQTQEISSHAHEKPPVTHASNSTLKLSSDFAKSHDGVQVPLTLVYNSTVQRNNTNPVLLIVYGAYGHALSLDYQAHRLPLLKQGWVVAYAHVRGGGELGRDWHQRGRSTSKSNSINDCLACINHLVNEGYTFQGGVAVEAHSAGGLIAAHMVDRHPNLLLGALLQMPFVDLWTCMSDPDLPLTTLEYEEWGDPRKDSEVKMLFDLCPYQSMTPGYSPPVFVTCALNDSRVPAWGPAKWVAKMREIKNGGPILLHTDFVGGHWGTSKDSSSLSAAQYAFLLSQWDKASKKLKLKTI